MTAIAAMEKAHKRPDPPSSRPIAIRSALVRSFPQQQ
jgi:hypothetical protein